MPLVPPLCGGGTGRAPMPEIHFRGREVRHSVVHVCVRPAESAANTTAPAGAEAGNGANTSAPAGAEAGAEEAAAASGVAAADATSAAAAAAATIEQEKPNRLVKALIVFELLASALTK